jgi:hypothetical protein
MDQHLEADGRAVKRIYVDLLCRDEQRPARAILRAALRS